MLPPKTLLILGAGASRPYGLPTASELRSLILGDSETAAWNLLPQMGFTSLDVYRKWLYDTLAPDFGKTPIEDFQRRFRDSNVDSVDSFLAEDANKSHRELGKAFIAAILLRCEKDPSLRGDWYKILLKYLRDVNRITGGPYLSIVTFNYDRSLEHFLYMSFRALLNSDEAAREVFDQITIVHVYGSLGSIFQAINISGILTPAHQAWIPVIPYGDDQEIKKAAGCINLVRANHSSTAIGDIRTLMLNAKRVVFLGFGFDPLNLAAIGINVNSLVQKSVFATRCGLSQPLQGAFERLISQKVTWGEPTENVADFLHSSEALG